MRTSEGRRLTHRVDQSRVQVTAALFGLGPVRVASPIATALATKTTAYSLTATDSVILADATGGAFTVTLPTAVGCQGRQYTVKRTNSGSNNVTVGATSSQTIDGAATKALGAQWSTIAVVSDGANWQIVNIFGTVS